ncbi:PH domain-containing protein [Zunongwangia endophytica]|uniref:PH domain-containing protein n=1 Tax=Zunongwangia endophytica TaxID=1808945 RepID=A0ABV8H7P5_9FLAO|nr:PH domain-containing protein [Zunongwangia endophytica]MDN3593635.1 PH domain-containing protein [Zunongwangia endophytica]
MDSIEPNFSNNTIDISGLPNFEQVALNSVSKKLLTKHLMQIGVWFLVVIGFGVFMYFKEEVFIGAIISSILILFLLFSVFDVVKKQSLYGYAVREKDIIYQRGFIISKKTVVSFNRVQHVSINRSLLDKWLGIATLKLFTAGGSGSDIKIPGLDPQMAEMLKEVLSGKITNEDV